MDPGIPIDNFRIFSRPGIFSSSQEVEVAWADGGHQRRKNPTKPSPGRDNKGISSLSISGSWHVCFNVGPLSYELVDINIYQPH
jgi:hypothetical protein